MSIKIKVAEMHKSQMKIKEIQSEIQMIEEFFKNKEIVFSKDTVNFALIKGIYQHIKRTMIVIGVYVNNTNIRLTGIESTLKLRFKNLNAQIAVAHGNFLPEFMGILEPQEGLLVHIEIPVKGLKEDEIFTIKDIEGQLEDVQLLIKNSKAQ